MSVGRERPRIVHLIDVGGTGGAETVFCQMVRFFDGRGENAVVLLPEAGWIADQLAGIVAPVRFVASRGSFSLRLLSSMVSRIRQGGGNVMVAHLLGSACYAAMAGLVLRIPVIAIFHGALDFECPGRMSWVKRWLLGRRHVRVIAVSEGVKEALVQWGLDADRVSIIANGVDTSVFRRRGSPDLHARLALAPEARLVGAVGNLHPVKGYELMLDAAAIVVRREPGVHFVVAGDGETAYRSSLERRRDELGLQANFHFLGFYHADGGHYSALDLLVSAASSEGLPLSFLEAMACAVPIVATANEGSTRLLASAHCGQTVPYGDPNALADSILDLLSDDAKARQLGAAGEEAARSRYSLNATLGAYQELLRRLV